MEEEKKGEIRIHFGIILVALVTILECTQMEYKFELKLKGMNEMKTSERERE